MKILTFSIILAAAVLSFASCNKQYDTEVSDSQTNNNNNGSGGGAGGSGFNWTGTAPMSAKVNGVDWTPYGAIVNLGAGYYISATSGQVFSSPTPGAVMWIDPIASLVLQGSPGKIKVVTNNTTTIEGYFWADLKDSQGLNDTIVRVTEGYFKVDKP
jgi:hypothetical protein